MSTFCCPGHDPLLRAGFLTCGECREPSYATDASWISETQILVAFEQAHKPGCPHRRQPHLVLIETTSDKQSVPLVDAPRRCKGTVRHGPRRGQQCSKPVGAQSAYCTMHDPARQGST
jgi:hypothetical protein